MAAFREKRVLRPKSHCSKGKKAKMVVKNGKIIKTAKKVENSGRF